MSGLMGKAKVLDCILSRLLFVVVGIRLESMVWINPTAAEHLKMEG